MSRSTLSGLSDREVEEILSGYRPPVAYRDSVKTVRVAVPVQRPRLASNATSTSCTTPSAGSTAGGSAAGPSLSSSETQRLRQRAARVLPVAG
jgi:hypothetical protein